MPNDAVAQDLKELLSSPCVPANLPITGHSSLTREPPRQGGLRRTRTNQNQQMINAYNRPRSLQCGWRLFELHDVLMPYALCGVASWSEAATT
jgi:hypothetical protein